MRRALLIATLLAASCDSDGPSCSAEAAQCFSDGRWALTYQLADGSSATEACGFQAPVELILTNGCIAAFGWSSYSAQASADCALRLTALSDDGPDADPLHTELELTLATVNGLRATGTARYTALGQGCETKQVPLAVSATRR